MPANLRIAILTLVAIIPAVAFSAEAPNLAKPHVIVPDEIAGVQTVTAEDVVNMVLAEPELLMIDARIHTDRIHGYIEGSISLPDISTNCKSLQQVNTNKHRHMLFYCNGVQCGRSVVSIKVAKSCGYTNMSWFKGGFEEWKNKGYQYLTEK